MKNRIKIAGLILLSTGLFACAGVKPNIAIPAVAPPVAPLKKPIQVAVVLGGGGARGYAEVGALVALENAGVPIDLVAGSSVGSIVAALYADQGDAKTMSKAMMQANFWAFADIENHPSFKGVVEGYHLQRFLLKNMQARNFSQTKVKLMVTGTDLTTGTTKTFESGPIAPAVNASAAVPGIAWPVQLYGKTYVDGGLADPIPVDLAKKYHPKLIIAIPIGKTLPDQMPTTARGIYQRGMLIIWLKYAALCEEGADVVIHPDVGQISIFDIADKKKLYDEGYNAAMKALPQIKQLMLERHISLKTV